MFKVVVAGSRNFNNYNLLKEKLDFLLQNKKNIEIVSGTARGADTLGERYAKERGYSLKRFPANWEKHGRKAGYIRNKEMRDYADAVVVFWDGESRGTKHMIDLSKEKNLPIKIIKYNRGE